LALFDNELIYSVEEDYYLLVKIKHKSYNALLTLSKHFVYYIRGELKMHSLTLMESNFRRKDSKKSNA
jgi:hypothetical protein